MPSFSLKVKSGKFVQDTDLRRLVEQELDGDLRRAGITMRDAIRSVEPIVSGNLHNRTDITATKWEGSGGVRTLRVVADTPYADRVNRTSKRHKGFWERGITKGRANTEQDIAQGARGLAPHLWIKR